jgi:hypothetical protein
VKTPKGTELPLLSLRGKDYLEVKYRLVWFREDHPDWSIETLLLQVTDKSCLAQAIIRDSSGGIKGMAHKFEDLKGFGDFIEKSETGAIGRALALCGYGTQFCADELDEGDRIVDAPAVRQKPTIDPGEHIVGGWAKKLKGSPIKKIEPHLLQEAIAWLGTPEGAETKKDRSAQEFIFYAQAYLQQKGIQ